MSYAIEVKYARNSDTPVEERTFLTSLSYPTFSTPFVFTTLKGTATGAWVKVMDVATTNNRETFIVVSNTSAAAISVHFGLTNPAPAGSFEEHVIMPGQQRLFEVPITSVWLKTLAGDGSTP